MGLLGEVFSYGDGLKRKLRGLLDDPAGTLALGVERFGEDQRGLLNLRANAYPMFGEKTVLNSPQQLAQFRRELADKATEQALAAATVWHGSPHKFDKFDSAKIGTGEGAQAYGHGLYLAQNPDVAKQYAGINPASSVRVLPNGKQFDVVAVHDSGPLREVGTFQSKAEAQKVASEYTGANHYKVDLPDEHIAKMLDWDKPLSQQPKEVQAALNQIPELTVQNKRIVGHRLDNSVAGGDQYRALANDNSFLGIPPGAGLAGQPGWTQSIVSKKLKELGIPGIRYLDGGSRGAGAGSSNYVVFPGNEGLLSILERNGAALK